MARLISLTTLFGIVIALPELGRRAVADAPSGYTPVSGNCPSTRPTVRSAGHLSSDESKWLEARRNFTTPALLDLLGSLKISGFDAAEYVKSQTNVTNLPNIGIALSGGGYRAMLTGGGALKAFDARETTGGGLGGLLQSSTYVAGLSGGGWLVGSLFVNNFTTVSALQGSSEGIWNLTNNLFRGSATTEDEEQAYYHSIGEEITGKQSAGFDTSITDYWGRTLSYQLINATKGGPSYTWSSIRDQPGFSTGEIPLPLVVADNRVSDQTVFRPTNTTVFEFNPFELGSWDPKTYGFVDLRYLGSNFSNGKLPEDEKCVRGYDNAGLVIGTTSSLFTPLASSLISTQIPKEFQAALGTIVQVTRQDGGLVTHLKPNPFRDWDPTGGSEYAKSDTLYLVDGGTDGQNLPLQPLLQPARAVDIIVAVDASNDINGYPNGSALIQTYARSQVSSIANGTSFPKVPDSNTFVNLGLNMRPTFFGCKEMNTPLVVYIPNAPYITKSNTSTYQLQYSHEQRDALITNGVLLATQGNGTANTEFRSCLGCAIISRSLDRTGTAVPAACQTCFDSYCWYNTTASEAPHSSYAPPMIGASPAGRGLNVTGSGPNVTSGPSPGWGMSMTGAAAGGKFISCGLAVLAMAFTGVAFF